MSELRKSAARAREVIEFIPISGLRAAVAKIVEPPAALATRMASDLYLLHLPTRA